MKFRTYIDCLQSAETGKQRIYADRATQKAEAGNEANEDERDDTVRPE